MCYYQKCHEKFSTKPILRYHWNYPYEKFSRDSRENLVRTSRNMTFLARISRDSHEQNWFLARISWNPHKKCHFSRESREILTKKLISQENLAKFSQNMSFLARISRDSHEKIDFSRKSDENLNSSRDSHEILKKNFSKVLFIFNNDIGLWFSNLFHNYIFCMQIWAV